jgi:hypothetical protein
LSHEYLELSPQNTTHIKIAPANERAYHDSLNTFNGKKTWQLETVKCFCLKHTHTHTHTHQASAHIRDDSVTFVSNIKWDI